VVKNNLKNKIITSSVKLMYTRGSKIFLLTSFFAK